MRAGTCSEGERRKDPRPDQRRQALETDGDAMADIARRPASSFVRGCLFGHGARTTEARMPRREHKRP